MPVAPPAANYPESPGQSDYPPAFPGNTQVSDGPQYRPSYAEADPSALTDFRAVLDPYGTWRDDPVYGNVWVPYRSAVGPNFQPYVTAGRWTYDDGWTWLSDYQWGSVPFHYGRWAWIPNVGWAWVPGRQYAGSWVDWRVGGGYIGWAPLPPTWIWRAGSAVPFRAQTPGYFFTKRDDVFAPKLAFNVGTGSTYYERTKPYRQVAVSAHANGGVRGPTPAVVGIPASRIVYPSPADSHLRRAREFARPGVPSAPPAKRVQ